MAVSHRQTEKNKTEQVWKMRENNDGVELKPFEVTFVNNVAKHFKGH